MADPGKRLTILTPKEVQTLYGLPRFSAEERDIYFTLDSLEKQHGQEKTNTILAEHSTILAHHSTILAQHKTALEALAAGQQDIRANMATKDGVEIAVEAAKIELKADNFTYFAPIAR